MIFIGLITLGITIGIISALFGVGGGFLTVPLLVSLFPEAPFQSAVGVSLTIIFINSSMVTYKFYQKGKKIPLLLFFVLAIDIISGPQIGALSSLGISAQTFKKIFASILLIAALKTLLIKTTASSNKPQYSSKKILVLGFITTFLSGLLSAFTGLGGGIILVPLFIFLLKVPLTDVAFFSNLIMMIGALMGAINYVILGWNESFIISADLASFQAGYVNLGLVFFLFLGGFVGTRLGVHLSPKVSPELSKRLFATLLFGMALKVIFIG